MNCPHREDLITFALDPLHEKYADLAGHICTCKSCQSDLADINKIILLPDEVTEDDIKSVKDFIRETKNDSKLSLWQQLKETVDEIWNNLSKSEEDTPFSFDRILPSMGASVFSNLLVGVASLASPMTSSRENFVNGDESEFVNIGFVADCDVSSPYYWKAEMVIPSSIAADDTLFVLLSDNNGKEIRKGIFTLLGVDLEFDYGIAEISFEKFRDNLKCTTVTLTYLDGTTMPGYLAPWKCCFRER